MPKKNSKTNIFENTKLNLRLFHLVTTLSMLLLLLSFLLYTGYYLFAIKYITIEGNIKYSSINDLILKLKKDKFINNLFTANLRAINNDILLDPWIKSASIVRQFPDNIIIRITEHKPKIYLNNHDIITEDNILLYNVVDNKFDDLVKFYVPFLYLDDAINYYNQAVSIFKKYQMPITSLYLPNPTTLIIYSQPDNKKVVLCSNNLEQKIKDFDINWNKIQQQYNIVSNNINYCYAHYIAVKLN